MNLNQLPIIERITKTIEHYYQKIYSLYRKYNKYVPVVAFFGGFGWDSLTLTRIDRPIDNIFLLAYLMFAGVFIVLINFSQNGIIKKNWLLKYQDWYPYALQFFLGGLFSGYVVFYFQSASVTKNWIFLGILVILLISNEFLEKRLNNLYLISALYFLAAFSFFIFFIPVITKIMNVFTFMVGAIWGLIFVLGCLFILYRKLESITREKFIKISLPSVFLFIILLIFYFQNLIPPVPLSLKDGGIFHHIKKHQNEYVLNFEKPKWYQFRKKSDTVFHYVEGDSVFCFASIFAPTKLEKKCYHHWQKYFPNQKKWITTDHHEYKITGGRDGGYRGYTYKRNVSPGKWRVDVETEKGSVLGRIKFTLVEHSGAERMFKTVFR